MCMFFPSSTLNVFCHSLLACSFCWKVGWKSISLLCDFFFLVAFQILSLDLTFIILIKYGLMYSFWVHFIWESLFPRPGCPLLPIWHFAFVTLDFHQLPVTTQIFFPWVYSEILVFHCPLVITVLFYFHLLRLGDQFQFLPLSFFFLRTSSGNKCCVCLH